MTPRYERWRVRTKVKVWECIAADERQVMSSQGELSQSARDCLSGRRGCDQASRGISSPLLLGRAFVEANETSSRWSDGTLIEKGERER